MKTFACALALIPAAAPALADGRAVIESPSPEGVQEIEIMWTGDGRVRIDPQRADAYMVVRDGALYSVTNAGGMGPMVMDLSSLGEMTAGASAAAPEGAQDFGAQIDARRAESVISIDATGRTETVAGIRGELHEITWRNSAGETQTDNAVLSDDPLARELEAAFASMAAVTASAGGEADARKEAIVARGLGVLRYGDEYLVLSIADETPPNGAFELPAEPTDLQGMMQGFGPNR